MKRALAVMALLILLLTGSTPQAVALQDAGGGAGGIITPPPPDEGVEVTAQMTVRRCLNYRRIVTYWMDMEMSPADAFDHLTDEHIPIILSIMAKESACQEHVTDGQSVGLMQVIPRGWLPKVNTNRMNIYVGMSIFDGCLRLSEGNIALALAYYNCGVPKVESDACGRTGGKYYAEDVLEFWLPRFN